MEGRRICWNISCGASEAKLICGNCKVARYCSKDCQKTSWNADHKQCCKGIAAAKTLMDESSAVDVRFIAFGNHQLDVHFDTISQHFPEFWPVVRRLLASDVTGLERRVNLGIYLCWFTNIVSFCHGTIEQASQRAPPGPSTFTGVNEARFVRFLEESNAWEDVLQVVRISVDLTIARGGLNTHLHQHITMSTLRAINDACCSRRVAAYILTHHMKHTGTELRALWLTVDAVTANDRLDAMEGLIYQIISLLDFWCERLGLKDEDDLTIVDRVGIKNGSPVQKRMYAMTRGFALNQIHTIDPEGLDGGVGGDK